LIRDRRVSLRERVAQAERRENEQPTEGKARDAHERDSTQMAPGKNCSTRRRSHAVNAVTRGSEPRDRLKINKLL